MLRRGAYLGRGGLDGRCGKGHLGDYFLSPPFPFFISVENDEKRNQTKNKYENQKYSTNDEVTKRRSNTRSLVQETNFPMPEIRTPYFQIFRLCGASFSDF